MLAAAVLASSRCFSASSSALIFAAARRERAVETPCGRQPSRPTAAASFASCPSVNLRAPRLSAGPGARDLLTLRALDRIHRADVVLHDALVESEVLEEVLAAKLGRVRDAHRTRAAVGEAMKREEMRAVQAQIDAAAAVNQ